MRLNKSTLLAAVLVVVGIGSFLGVFIYGNYVERPSQQAGFQQSQSYPTGMGGGYGGYGGMMGTQTGMVSNGQSISITQAVQTMQTIPSYVRVFAGNNSISVESQKSTIFVLAIMPDKAMNLTGRQLPSYSTDDVFVIYGLINPTIVVHAGTSVQFTVANLDDDMYHNLVVSAYGPPYAYMAIQGMMQGNWMPYLPPANYNQNTAHEYSYTLTLNQPTTLWYICTYPDHAQTGMYGKMIVTN